MQTSYSLSASRPGYPLMAGYLFALLLCAGFGNAVVVLGWSDNPVNLFHYVVLCGLPLLLLIRNIALPPWPLILFMLSGAVTSMIAYLPYGIQNDNPLQPLYCVVTLFLGLAIGGHLPIVVVRRVLVAVSISYIALVAIKDVVFAPEILDTLRSGQRVWIPTLSLGEVNSEATFLIVCATFLFGTFYFWPGLAVVAFLIFLYSSRASFISIAAVVFYALVYVRGHGTGGLKLSKWVMITVGVIIGLAALLISPLGHSLLERFGEIGYETGTFMRLLIWREALDIFMQHPFGVGAQNGIAMVQLTEANTLIEDNLHSVMLQYMVDLGIHSLMLFLFAVYYMVKRVPKTMLGHPLTLTMLSFAVMGLSHYSGYETFSYLWLGLWLGQWKEAAESQAHA